MKEKFAFRVGQKVTLVGRDTTATVIHRYRNPSKPTKSLRELNVLEDANMYVVRLDKGVAHPAISEHFCNIARAECAFLPVT